MAISTGAALAIIGTQVAGSVISGIAANKAGNKQADVAKDQLKFQEKAYSDSMARMNQFLSEAQKFSQPSVADLKAMERLVATADNQYKLSVQSFKQAEEVLSAVNPAIAEAGAEAYRLIKGEQANVLKPLRESRERQRKGIEQSLAQKFGPGFRFSAAGIKALNDFDFQTSDMLNQAQFGAMNQVVNAATGLSGVANSALQRGISGIQASQQADLSTIQAGTELSRRQFQPYYIAAQFQPNPAGVGNAGQNLASVIGNQYAGTMSVGQGLQSLASNVGMAALMGGFNSTGTPPPIGGVTTPSTGDIFRAPTFGQSSGIRAAPNYTLGDFSF